MKYYLNDITKSFEKRTFFYFISLMLMASTFLPLLYYNLRLVTNNIGWSIIWFFSLIVFKPQVFKNKLLLIYLLYFVIFIILLHTLWLNVTDWNKEVITVECYAILVAISVLTYFRTEQDFYHFAKLIKWTLVFIFITAVLTIITSLINPLYARQLNAIAAIRATESENILKYDKYGGGDYSFASALVCLFPLFIYYLRNNFKIIIKKRYILGYIIILFIALLRMQFFANILISLTAIILSIAGSNNVKRVLPLSFLVVLIILFIPMQFYANIFETIGAWFPINSEIHLKLISMSKYILYGNSLHTQIGIRASRYPLLLPAFEANPLVGYFVTDHTVDISPGGHLYWMNKLAVYGLLGTVPFLYILYNYVKESLKSFDREFAYYFILSCFSIFSLGLMKALYGRETWYVFIIICPGLYYLPLLNNKNKRIGINL
jgi:hypothetical protein